MRRLFLIVTLALVALSAHASIEVYEFRSELDKVRFQALAAELRCPKCQNQNIADSDAPIAKDMKDIVHEMLMANKSDGEIKDYLVARYGSFVLYTPEVKGANVLLWGGPPALLLCAILIAVVLVRRKAAVTNHIKIAPEDLKKLEEELGNH